MKDGGGQLGPTCAIPGASLGQFGDGVGQLGAAWANLVAMWSQLGAAGVSLGQRGPTWWPLGANLDQWEGQLGAALNECQAPYLPRVCTTSHTSSNHTTTQTIAHRPTMH